MKAPASALNAGFHRAVPNAEFFGGLFLRKISEVGKFEGFAIFGSELSEHRAQTLHEAATQLLRWRVLQRLAASPRLVREARHRPSLAGSPAVVVDHGVGNDALEPRHRRVPFGSCLRFAQQPKHHFLHDVFGVG